MLLLVFSYDSSDVHWLPTELLRNDKKPPLVAHCSSKGDVWALATTFWEIFSFGATPLADIPGTEVAERYLRGERLAKPDRIKGERLARNSTGKKSVAAREIQIYLFIFN